MLWSEDGSLESEESLIKDDNNKEISNIRPSHACTELVEVPITPSKSIQLQFKKDSKP